RPRPRGPAVGRPRRYRERLRRRGRRITEWRHAHHVQPLIPHVDGATPTPARSSVGVADVGPSCDPSRMKEALRPFRLGIGVVVTLLVSAVFLTPASAQTHVRARDSRHISISGDVVVDQGETVNGPVVSVDGSARINGVVRDDVYVGSGNVRV